jgi:hypothetical protein
MHSPISICGELSCCRGRRVMLCGLLLHTHLGLRRDMNVHYPPSGQERKDHEKPTEREPRLRPDHQTELVVQSHLSESITSPHHHHQYSQCFCFALLFPPDDVCNVNLDHALPLTPQKHQTYLPCHHPPVANPLVIVLLPSIGKDTRPLFALLALLLTAMHGFTKQMQAYLSQSHPSESHPTA